MRRIHITNEIICCAFWFTIHGAKAHPFRNSSVSLCVSVLCMYRSSLLPTNHYNNNSFSIYRIESDSFVSRYGVTKREREKKHKVKREWKKPIGPPPIWCAVWCTEIERIKWLRGTLWLLIICIRPCPLELMCVYLSLRVDSVHAQSNTKILGKKVAINGHTFSIACVRNVLKIG